MSSKADYCKSVLENNIIDSNKKPRFAIPQTAASPAIEEIRARNLSVAHLGTHFSVKSILNTETPPIKGEPDADGSTDNDHLCRQNDPTPRPF